MYEYCTRLGVSAVLERSDRSQHCKMNWQGARAYTNQSKL